MSHQHLPQIQIWPFVALLTLLFVSPLPAQNKLNQLTDSLKQNVIAIKVIFTDDSEEKGFGFITGEQSGRLFLATAAHVVRGIDNDKTAKSIKVRFYNDYRWFDAAFIRHWDQEDLALLDMAKPAFVRWKKDCADFAPGTNAKVRFIGLNDNEPNWVDPGLEGNIFQQNEKQLSFAISTIRPGTSGAPLITEKGIVGLIIEDEGSVSRALKLTQIKSLFGGSGQYPYFTLNPLGGALATLPVQNSEAAKNQLDEYEMVLVKGGSFKMGCTREQGKDCFQSEKPSHQVTLGDFYIGKYEVTQAQWRAIMGSDPPHSSFKGNSALEYNKVQRPGSESNDPPSLDVRSCDQCPVEGVSWEDIQDFLNKLQAKTGKNYRLPSEAEWEYAARGGNQSKGYKYAGSNTIDEVAWYDSNAGKKTHPVGSKRANELGLYDMSGNVSEFCRDWSGEYSSKAQVNPGGSDFGSTRTLRGGSWGLPPNSNRVSFRGGYMPRFRSNTSGFRLAL